MTFEYEKPTVEILTFVAQQTLATAHAEREARDDVKDDNVGITPTPSVSEGVEDGW